MYEHSGKWKIKKSQLHDLKQAQNSENSQLHQTLIDPAVNLVFERMKSQLSDYKEKLDQAQSDLSAWKFTPDRLAVERKHILRKTTYLTNVTLLINNIVIEWQWMFVHVSTLCV